MNIPEFKLRQWYLLDLRREWAPVKTTFLKIIAGMIALSGEATINNTSLKRAAALIAENW